MYKVVDGAIYFRKKKPVNIKIISFYFFETQKI